jgi:protein gp37
VAAQTEIAWCDSTFNPWIGCTNVSPGCDHCYAEQQDKFRGWTPEGWGAGKPRRRTSESLWAQPLKWNAEPFYQCTACGWRGGHLELEKRPCGCRSEHMIHARRRVFCASLADVFDNEVDISWRADLFFLIEQTPNLDWLLLTKRIGNVTRMVAETSDYLATVHKPLAWPLPNVWLGATIVNQDEADRDIPKLLATPARVRFLSMEPLLGEVDLSQWLFPFQPCKDCPCPNPDVSREGLEQCCRDPELMPSGIHWVIAGGESGPKARPMHPDWARALRDQCAAAGVPFLFKQWGEWTPGEIDDPADGTRAWVDEYGTGVNIEGRQRPVTMGEVAFCRIGKKAAGRVLDQHTHDGFPEVACAT